MTVKSSISLTDEQAAFARALVAEGRYASVSAVVQQGLDMLKARTEDEALERDALHQLLSERRNGQFVSGEAMNDAIANHARRKRAAHGL